MEKSTTGTELSRHWYFTFFSSTNDFHCWLQNIYALFLMARKPTYRLDCLFPQETVGHPQESCIFFSPCGGLHNSHVVQIKQGEPSTFHGVPRMWRGASQGLFPASLAAALQLQAATSSSPFPRAFWIVFVKANCKWNPIQCHGVWFLFFVFFFF